MGLIRTITDYQNLSSQLLCKLIRLYDCRALIVIFVHSRANFTFTFGPSKASIPIQRWPINGESRDLGRPLFQKFSPCSRYRILPFMQARIPANDARGQLHIRESTAQTHLTLLGPIPYSSPFVASLFLSPCLYLFCPSLCTKKCLLSKAIGGLRSVVSFPSGVWGKQSPFRENISL